MGIPAAPVIPERPLLLGEAQAAAVLGLPLEAFKACALPSESVAGEVRWLRSELEQFVEGLGKKKKTR